MIDKKGKWCKKNLNIAYLKLINELEIRRYTAM